jgi:hypothetical protein
MLGVGMKSRSYVFVLKPVSGDDLNIGVFGGASRQKLFFELRICSTALGRTIPSTGRS